MMKHVAALIALFIAHIVHAQTVPFRVVPERPVPGDKITIHYNPTGTVLEGLAPVKGTITLFRNFAWETEDLEMQMTDSGWTTNYLLPTDAALIACNFSAAGKTDKGGKSTYAWMLSDKQGKQARGAFYAWALLRANGQKFRVPNVTDDSAAIGNDVVMFWMRNEVRDHPESRRHIFYEALTALKADVGSRADSTILKETAFVGSLPDVTEKELIKIRNLYKTIPENKQLIDSIEQMILRKYPNGQLAWDRAVFAMFIESNAVKRDSLWQDFSKRFSVADSKYVVGETADMYYAKVFKAIVFNQIISKKNYAIIDDMAENAPLTCLYDFHRHIVEYPLERIDEQKRTPQQVIGLSNTLIRLIEKAALDRRLPEAYGYSASQWEEKVTKLFSSAFKTHARVLAATGQPENALSYAEKSRSTNRIKDADFNGLYTDLLLKNDRTEEASPFIELCVRENAATPEMLTILKSSYKKKNGTEKGFQEYVNSLKSTDKLEAQRAHLKASLINSPIESFVLESNKGGRISLAKQKGKIVVLDFWATWCGPCKAAMPGMQLAVDKYKSDKNVEFYFISTQEVNPNYRRMIDEFMKEKKYDFTVLYDAKSSSGKLDDTYSKYAKSIGFSGIPQKMIIDAKGNLRWRSTGYFGSPTELADEISYIIEILKSEK